MNIFDRFVLFYVSLIHLFIDWMHKNKISPFFIEIALHMVFAVFFCRLKGKVLLRSSAR
jgi:hypothetical protein